MNAHIRDARREGYLAALAERTALEDAARRWAASVIAHQQSNGRTALEALLERETAEHELIVLAGYACPFCSTGDCPLQPHEWQDDRDQDREDRHDELYGRG